MTRSTLYLSALILPLLFLAHCADTETPEPTSPAAPSKPAWYKGNLHMQSYWSDGDDYPEMILKWYREHGYDFAAMSDHDRLAEGEQWISFSQDSDSADVFREYLEAFGEEWVTYRREDNLIHVRLKPHEAYHRAPGADSLLVLQAEEISDSFDGRPLHLNAVNLTRAIRPQGGDSVSDVIRNNLDAVRLQEQRNGEEILFQLNHPNYERMVGARDLMELEELRFMEIYNGHPSVQNYRDRHQASTEEKWDAVNAYNVLNGRSLLLGTATDDAHNYHSIGAGMSNPGRGWVHVWSRGLRAGALIQAMRRGHFYASSGVSIRGIRVDGDTLHLSIDGEEGVTYRTQFVGALDVKPADGGLPPDTVLAEIEGIDPSYTFRGDELFVRARVISSRLKENPYREGDREMAWTQPVLPGKTSHTLGFFKSDGND